MMDESTVKAAVKEAFKEEMSAFYVEREQHYQDHQFIKELREWCVQTKSTVLKTVVKVVVGGALALLFLGFIFKVKEHIVK